MAPLPTLPELLDDLAAEHAELDAVVADLDEARWATPTPAVGWSVGDQLGHLAFFDDAATMAVVDPEGFSSLADAAVEAAGNGADPMAEHLVRGRAMAGSEVLAWWRRARGAFLQAARRIEPSRRVQWFGPPMSPMSFVSARLMETWAHGQDVHDALGVRRLPSARLAHVAQLGVRARAFSYAVRGLDPPQADVSVELLSPHGETWRWGDAAAGQAVRGTALDFCLVVTQRRNVADTELEVEGDEARRWMQVAQAFAGPPGPGRPPASA